MEESTATAAPNRTMLILLGTIVVLLVVIAVIIFTGRSGDTTGTGTAADTGTTAGTGTMPGATAATPFDPATATKVPAGQTPDEYVKQYFDAIVAGDFATAYALLPADKKVAQDEASFTEQLSSYGIAAYTIDDSTTEGDEAQVLATATAPGGAFQYLWTFVKDGENWLVKSRTLPGMGQ
jgi:hypothetical protein